MNKKQKNAEEIKYLKEVNEERKRVNKKCAIFIQPKYIIEKVEKDLKKEGFAEDTVYVIMKKV